MGENRMLNVIFIKKKRILLGGIDFLHEKRRFPAGKCYAILQKID